VPSGIHFEVIIHTTSLRRQQQRMILFSQQAEYRYTIEIGPNITITMAG
jgi:hypothetical protein